MKKIILFFILLLAFGCKGGGKKFIQDSKGAPYEIFVVIDKANWQGAMGDTLRKTLNELVPMLNQDEPMFNVISVRHVDFERLVKSHRNILVVNVGKEYPQPSMTAEYDLYAQPQIQVNVTGPNDTTLLKYISENKDALQKIFNITERDRAILRAQKETDPAINQLLEDKFGFKMSVPRGYRVRVEKPNFVWMSNELPLVSQGMVIYSYPYTGKGNFTVENMVKMRNSFVNKFIPGPSDGSYMNTAELITPHMNTIHINGRVWVQLRGFWDVKGNYMGGPFVSYSTVDQATGMVVVMDNYLFSPRNPKRNYYRQLENLVFTVRFPGDAEPEVKPQ